MVRTFASVVTALGVLVAVGQCGAQRAGGPFTRPLLPNISYMDVLPPMVPVAEFYSDPSFDNVLISPTGRYFSYLAPSNTTGHLNVFIQDVTQYKPPVQVTDAPFDILTGRYAWSRNEHYIIYSQNPVTGRGVGPGSHIFRAFFTPEEGPTVDLTPQLDNYTILTDFQTGNGNPIKVAVGLIILDFTGPPRRNLNYFLLDLETGDMEQITNNPGDVAQYVLDQDLFPRAAKAGNGTGMWVLRTRADNTSDWVDVFEWDDDDPSGPLMGGDMPLTFNVNGSSMYLLSSKGYDTMRLIQINTATGELEANLAHSNRTDVVGVVFNPSTSTVDAVSFDYLRRQWVALDPTTNNLLQTLQMYFNGSADYDVMSMDNMGSVWAVTRTLDSGPVQWYLFNRRTRRLTFLSSVSPLLAAKSWLSKMQGVVIPTPDGLNLPSYLTLPPVPPGFFGPPTELMVGPKSGRISKSPMNLPLIVFPHPGPANRDHWGFHPLVQLLANRGYAVLQVNYRGSSGFGKAFMNAGEGQWGLKMQDDLVTAVNWAIDQGIADPSRVAIYGMQYGGYAALMGLTRDPSVFTCCAAALAPIANITYIASSFPDFANITGMEVGADLDEQISPIYHIDNITSPLLIGDGSLNDRVSVASSLAISAALDKRRIPNQLFVYGGEINGIAQEPNRIDFATRLEQFFAKYLGGRALPPVDVLGSTVHPLNATDLMTFTAAKVAAVPVTDPSLYTIKPMPAGAAAGPLGNAAGPLGYGYAAAPLVSASSPGGSALAPNGGFLGV